MKQTGTGLQGREALTAPAGGRSDGAAVREQPVRLMNPAVPSQARVGVNAGASREPALALLALLIHQVSQPLTTLLGEVELALRLPQGERELRATLARCLQSLDLLSERVSDFRLVGEMNAAVISVFPLPGLISRIVETQRAAAEVCGCRILWEAAAEGAIRSDREVLERAISQILAKAVNMCQRGGSVGIDLAEVAGATMLRLSCLRTDPAAASHLIALETDPEWALAEGMIRLLGGSLEVYSDCHPERRTSIDMTLPSGEMISQVQAVACRTVPYRIW